MEPAVSMVLTTILWSFTAWDDLGDTRFSWLPSEVEARPSAGTDPTAGGTLEAAGDQYHANILVFILCQLVLSYF